MELIPLDARRLIWSYCDGCPLRYVCREWRDNCKSRKLSRRNLSRVEIAIWARANGCPWNEWTCANAAEGGHLAVLQWARENGCPWNEETCSYAAVGGHLAVLQWARTNGCPG